MKTDGSVRKEAPLTLGVDVGATKTEIALVDPTGNVVDSERNPTAADEGPESFVRNLVSAVGTLLQRAPTSMRSVSVLGLGIAGQIERATGVLRSSPNLGFRDVPLQSLLEDALELQVVVLNDVIAATWAEWQFGAGREARDVVCVYVGTGVGAGVVSGGRLLEGSRCWATELGHVPIVFNGRNCSCRHRGCLEAYAGGWAIAERARERIEQYPDNGKSRLASMAAKETLTAKHVADAFHEEDPLAQRLVEETGRYLATAAVGIVNTFNPSLLIFGGGVIEGLPELTDGVPEAVRDHSFVAFAEGVRVAHATLGHAAGVIGASGFARRQYERASRSHAV